MRALSPLWLAVLCGCAGEGFADEGIETADAVQTPIMARAAVAPDGVAANAVITWAPTPREEPPARLTASDGTGLAMVKAKVKAVVQEPLAFTELHLTFENPENRTREGRFEITLPDGAAISRFAMKIDGRWQEGEVVEKQRARRIYEDFLHRRQDPALLEQDAGNTFRARVFPIPAGGTKDLVLSFSQEVVDGTWSLPLAGLDQLDLDVDVTVVDHTGASRTLSESRTAWTPDADLKVAAGAPGAMGLSAGEYHVMRVQAPFSSADAKIRDLTVLMDTSASRALSLEADLERLQGIVGDLPGGTSLTVACFDQTVEPCWSGPARRFGQAGVAAIAQRRALGASNLERALRWAAERDRGDRLLIVSDGVPTAGALEAGPLEAILATSSYERADVLAPVGARDVDLLRALVRGDLPQDGVVVDLTEDNAAERLTRATRSGIEVSVPGAAWVWPNVLHGVQPGDERLVYAVLPDGGTPEVHLDGQVATQPASFRPAQRPLLERAAVNANLSRLQAKRGKTKDEAERRTLTEEIIGLSTRYRVLTGDTALLVLETEEDYRRYDLARNGLADILEVGDDGVVLRKRDGWVVPPAGASNPITADAVEKKTAAKSEAPGDGFLDGGLMDPAAAEPVPETAARTNSVRESTAVRGATGGSAPMRRRAPADMPAPPSRPAPPSTETVDRIVAVSDEAAPAMLENLDEEEPVEPEADKSEVTHPWDGRYAAFRAQLDRGDAPGALAEAQRWRADDPLDVMALVALGEASLATGDPSQAARAYGSILDLYPSRADLRRMAGERLESLGEAGLALAVDTFTVANAQRPDQITGGRLLAFSLVQAGKPAKAFDVLEQALRTETRDRSGVEQLLREDLGLIGAAWIAARPESRDEIVARAQAAGAVPPTGASTRFVLSWETDANDVDLHIRDARGGHAYYSSKSLASGGALIADVTNGYGPEAFVIAGAPAAGPYELSAHYYSRGPMGYGMGTLQIVHHDGAGGITVEARPFVVMVDGSTVQLGRFDG